MIFAQASKSDQVVYEDIFRIGCSMGRRAIPTPIIVKIIANLMWSIKNSTIFLKCHRISIKIIKL